MFWKALFKRALSTRARILPRHRNFDKTTSITLKESSQLRSSISSDMRKNPEYKNCLLPLYLAKPNGLSSTDLLKEALVPLEQACLERRILTPKELLPLLMSLVQNGDGHQISLELLSWLDKSLSSHSWTPDQSFRIMDSLSLLLPDIFFTGYYFQNCTSIWEELVAKDPSSIPLAIHFLCWDRLHMLKHFKSSNNLFRQMNKAPQPSFSMEEWIIICRRLYKVKKNLLSPTLLQDLASKANSCLDSLDHHDIVVVFQVFRHNNYYDPGVFDSLKSIINSRIKSLDLSQLVGFLYLYSSMRVYDYEVYNQAEEQLLNILESSSTPQYSFTHILHKDIARILWSFAWMNHVPGFPHFFSLVTDFLRLKMQDPIRTKHNLDCFQSLAMLQTYPKELVPAIFYPPYTRYSKSYPKEGDFKPYQQMYYMHQSVMIEAPWVYSEHWDPKINWRTAPYWSVLHELKDRPQLFQLVSLARRFTGEDVTLKRLLSHIPISGVTFRVTKKGYFHGLTREVPITKSLYKMEGTDSSLPEEDPVSYQVCLELLDASVCRRDSPVILGTMETKVRQLQLMDNFVLCLRPVQLSTLLALSPQALSNQLSILIRHCIESSIKPASLVSDTKSASSSDINSTLSPDILSESPTTEHPPKNSFQYLFANANSTPDTMSAALNIA